MKLDRFKKGFRGMEKDLLKIIEHFRVNNQQRKLQEEIFELQEAITTHELKKSVEYEIPLTEIIGTKEHITEEIVDTMILLKQFQHYYKINREDIRKTMKNKIKRTLERIESGYYEK